ncbi:hypothetical protein BGW36DRAFT_315046 [Talaromyces proteolyticus]|uniref:CS domain-containing protein n=1 Tax=Talaromyces proteolyticus TaxID=1131652 RepID=A0AAD4KXT5_9EURO|nr:uncharacterized protein BGW36DRAFT_315046 [Talaromyces proteolyticus]KAH8702271.1 hypothetical protein BGW36DRAFT_315046 [Talaromyces proteolyticus]
MNTASEGDKAAAASDWAAAIKHYTNALIELPRAPGYYIKRSTAYSRRKDGEGGPDYHAALRDVELALALARERGKRELIIEAQIRRAIVFFQLEKYGDAGYLFDILAEKLGVGEKQKAEDKSAQVQAAMTQKGSQKQENELSIWKIKVKGKIDKLDANDQRLAVTVKEYPDTKIPSEQELKKNLTAQLAASTTSGIVEELPDDKPAGDKTKETKLDVAGPGSAAPFTAGPGAPPAAAPAPAPVKVRHEWYQSHDSVVVTVYAKNVKKDELEVDLQDDSLSLEFPLSTGSTFAFNLDPFYSSIDPAQSKVNVLSTKIEITLRKKTPGQKWGALEGTATDTKPIITPSIQPSQSTAPSYPTSSKHGVKNWDKLATDLTKKKDKKSEAKKPEDNAGSGGDDDDDDAESIDSEYGGGDAVDSFFKKLYANADPDTRRAMMKSYQESQGTSLSTNWDEVGKKTVPVHPPSSD